MKKGHQVERSVPISEFLERIREMGEDCVHTTDHTFFRLNEQQRKIYKGEIIKQLIQGQDPVYVGIQYNGLYAVFYKYEKDTIRIMMDISPTHINVVTFYIVDDDKIPHV